MIKHLKDLLYPVFFIALVILQACSSHSPEKARQHLAAARKYFDAARYKEAMQEADEAISNNPESWRAYTFRALLRLKHTGDTLKALDDLNSALKLNPQDTQALPLRCLVYMHRHLWKDALTDCDKLLTLQQDTSRKALITEGLIMAETGDLADALSEENEAVRLNPAKPNAWCNRGYVKLKMGDLKGAASDLRHALALKPDNAMTYRNLALYHLAMHQPDSARRYALAGIHKHCYEPNVYRELDSIGKGH